MNECMYCTMNENGDIPMERKDVFNIGLGNAFGYELRVTGTIGHNNLFIGTEVGIYSGPCDPIKINYCPICGRKLSE